MKSDWMAYDSIRREEQPYEKEMRQTYKEHPHLFVTHCSDLLHLQLSHKREGEIQYQCITTKSDYKKYDIIFQVRGSIMGYDKLKKIVEEGKVDSLKLPLLLYLNFQQQYLLSPKNIAKYLFTNPLYRKGSPNTQSQNCYLENHFGSKILAMASRDIHEGEQLVLQQQSYNRSVYTFNPQQF